MNDADLKNTLSFCQSSMRTLEKGGNMMTLSSASLEHLKWSVQHDIAKMMLEEIAPLIDANLRLRERVTRLEEIILQAIPLFLEKQ